MVTFAIHGYEGTDPAYEFGPLQAEFGRRGLPPDRPLPTHETKDQGLPAVSQNRGRDRDAWHGAGTCDHRAHRPPAWGGVTWATNASNGGLIVGMELPLIE